MDRELRPIYLDDKNPKPVEFSTDMGEGHHKESFWLRRHGGPIPQDFALVTIFNCPLLMLI